MFLSSLVLANLNNLWESVRFFWGVAEGLQLIDEYINQSASSESCTTILATYWHIQNSPYIPNPLFSVSG